jgi:hypothetical protein
MLKDPGLEVVLPEAAMLDTLPPKLLSPGVLPELWQGPELALKDLHNYFSGRTVRIERECYQDVVVIPQAERDVVDAAIQAAVKEKKLWLTSESASFFAEDIPAGVLSDHSFRNLISEIRLLKVLLLIVSTIGYELTLMSSESKRQRKKERSMYTYSGRLSCSRQAQASTSETRSTAGRLFDCRQNPVPFTFTIRSMVVRVSPSGRRTALSWMAVSTMVRK